MSPRSRLAVACVVMFALAGCRQPGPDAPATGGGDTAEGVVVSDAWIRETPPGAAVAGGYFTIRSAADDRLLAVESEAAGSVEMHEMRHDGGMMRMRELADGIPLPAGATVSLAPGGHHLMFIGPVEPVRAGQTVEATLLFEHAAAQTVTFEVRPLAGGAAPAGDAPH